GRMCFEEGTLKNAQAADAKSRQALSGGAPSDEPIVLIGELSLPGNGFRLPVPDHLVEALSGKVGGHVVLGIRPEHFRLNRGDAADGAGDLAPLAVEVSVVEPLGNDIDVYMKTALIDHV